VAVLPLAVVTEIMPSSVSNITGAGTLQNDLRAPAQELLWTTLLRPDLDYCFCKMAGIRLPMSYYCMEMIQGNATRFMWLGGLGYKKKYRNLHLLLILYIN
jgi:hypothetical protein